MKQKKIEKQLKAMIIFIACVGIGVLIFGNLFLPAMLCPTKKLFISHEILAGIMTFFCISILLQFWKVCTQIGRDNSFSVENAKSFRVMSYNMMGISISYGIRILYLLLAHAGSIAGLFYSLFLVAAGVVGMMLCRILSELIYNAYEVKQENELTI